MAKGMFRRGLSAVAISTSALLTYQSFAACEKPRTFIDELHRLRKMEKEMTERWIKDEEGWRKLPSRVWPVNQPQLDQLDTINKQIQQHCTTKSARCDELRFDLATLNVFNNLDTELGYAMYVQLAKEGNVDGIVAVGMCLVEGYGVEQNYALGIDYLRQASALGHPQGDYELGVLYYTGAAGSILPEDETKALEYFERAMERGKYSYASYMVADLLFQNGTKADYPRALNLMYSAAENGHRFARQEIQMLLDGTHRLFKSQ